MKANELMIGDWVYALHEPKTPARVDAIYSFGGISYIMPDETSGISNVVNPIPLTPEILEKNGFEKYTDTLYGLVEHFTVEIRLWDDILIRIGERYDSTFRVGYNWFVNGLIISDVHQLQHCLKMVGIEKEIEL